MLHIIHRVHYTWQNTVISRENKKGFVPLICKSTNSGPRAPTASPLGLSHSGPLTPCPNHPKIRNQTARTAPTAQSPQKLFQLRSPMPPCPAWPLSSCRKHRVYLSSPLSLSLPAHASFVLPHVALHWCAIPAVSMGE